MNLKSINLFIFASLFSVLAVQATPNWVTFTPSCQGGSDFVGYGYAMPVGQCINFGFSFWATISLSNQAQTVDILYYNDESCKTKAFHGFSYTVEKCYRINAFSLNTDGFVSVGQNFPDNSVNFNFFYLSDDACAGDYFTIYYTNNLTMNAFNYQCIDEVPIVSSCDSESSEDDIEIPHILNQNSQISYNAQQPDCSVIPYFSTGQCIPASQMGPGYFYCGTPPTSSEASHS